MNEFLEIQKNVTDLFFESKTSNSIKNHEINATLEELFGEKFSFKKNTISNWKNRGIPKSKLIYFVEYLLDKKGLSGIDKIGLKEKYLLLRQENNIKISKIIDKSFFEAGMYYKNGLIDTAFKIAKKSVDNGNDYKFFHHIIDLLHNKIYSQSSI